MSLAVTALIGFGVSLALVPLCRLAARRLGYTSQPKQDRWHRQPTPLLGGVGIAVSVLAVYSILGSPLQRPVLLAGASCIFLLGLLDDIVDLKPYTKLVAEITIASLFVFVGYRLNWSSSLTLDTVLTMVWIVGLTNAFNLLDNMDGLCAGIGLIVGMALLATSMLATGLTPEAAYLSILLGAMAGFLVYNVYPASIFMGDSGSLFIGLNLAVLTLSSQNIADGPSSVLAIVAAPLLVLLVPIFDTTLVTVSRLVSGRSAAQGGRDHSSHRLVAMGLSERAAVAVLWTLAALGGLLGISLSRFQNDWPSLASAVFLLAMIIFAVYLAHIRVYQDDEDALASGGRITPFVVRLMYKRRVAEVLLDACLVTIAYYSAYRLRFEGPEFGLFFQSFLQSLPLVVGVQMIAMFGVGVYRGIWRYFGLMDAVALVKGVLFGTFGIVLLVVYLYRFQSYSRGIFVIYGALLLLLLSGSRASFRLIGEFTNRRRHAGQRVVIYGAGDGASMAVRELLGRTAEGYRMLGYIDDDPGMAQTRMQGYPVLGNFSALVALVTNGGVDTVVITTPLIGEERLEALRQLCVERQVALARLNFKLDDIVAASW
jgi:UDP-GlcNAc:undecaprenyl-phosphate/decaprenyl-phosphate GlcNAc-1-phosphate transferase